MPATFQEVIRNHHFVSLPQNEHTLCRIVRLADVIVMSIYSTSIQTLERSVSQIGRLSESLGIKKEFVDNLTFSLLDETLQAAGKIGIDIGDTTDLLNRANRELCKAYFTIEGLFRERQELSRKILCEERLEGMLQSKNIAIATLSHYLNNIATAISGRVQLLQMALNSGLLVDQKGTVPPSLKVIETSVARLLAVLAELRSLSSYDDQSFYNNSEALNIDEKLKERLTAVIEESEPPGTLPAR
jgi:signal transduction histidine kinase